MAGDLTLREYEDWVRPADALERAIQRFGKRSAIRNLWDVLDDGRLHAVAETASDSTFGNFTQRFVFIPVAHWRAVGQQGPDSFFWLLADLSVSLSPTMYTARVIDYQGIRFNPRQLDKLLEPARSAGSPTGVAAPNKAERATPKKNVPTRELAAWYARYRAANEGTPADAIPVAWARAKEAFPANSIPRRLIREVMQPTSGKRTSGPKGPRIPR